MHGGAAPQVKRKAKERLMELREPALVALGKVLRDPKADDGTKVRAALGILDRTGLGPNVKVEADVTVKPWQSVLAKVYGAAGGSLEEVLTEEQREAVESADRTAIERELRAAQARVRALEAGGRQQPDPIDGEWTERDYTPRRALPPAEPEVEAEPEPVPKAERKAAKPKAERVRLKSADPRDAALRAAGYTAEPYTRPKPKRRA